MTIYRRKISYEELKIPEGYKICTYCKGKGLLSKYDMGWSSVVHDPELAALEECYACGGSGVIPSGD
jgi:hypothetical protein